MSRGLDLRSIFSHPIFLITLIASILGWWTAFIGQIITEMKWQRDGFAGSAVGVEWFGILLQLVMILRVFWTLATDNIAGARFQLSIFLGVALVFSVLGINYGIYAPTSYVKAMGVGWFLLTVCNVTWLLYFTSEEDSATLRLLDSASSQKFSHSNSNSRRSRQSPSNSNNNNNNSSSMSNNNSGGNAYLQSQQVAQQQNSYSNSGLGLSASNGQGLGQTKSQSLSKQMSNNDLRNGGGGDAASMTNGGGGGSYENGNGGNGSEYALKAKALYAYNASPDDPNEISFSKGEILSIVDNSGKWWQAKKDDGTKGIIPSNYVVLC